MSEKLVTDKAFISKLCQAIEKRVGRKMISPRDFDYLCEELTKVGARVSGSTLKRVWGYNRDISSNYRPYRYTLVSMVKLLGFKDLETFTNNYEEEEIPSAEFMGETIMAEDIAPGSIVNLSWAPDRRCTLVCIEKARFKVVHSERGYLQPGDLVTFMSLTQNAPLYFSEVIRFGTNEKLIYTAGQRTGIRYHIRGIVNTEEDSVLSTD